MALPALSHLAQAGFTPMLVGRPWSRTLLAAYGWEIEPRGASLRARVAQLRHLHHRAARADAQFGRHTP